MISSRIAFWEGIAQHGVDELHLTVGRQCRQHLPTAQHRRLAIAREASAPLTQQRHRART
jgi:hypothetical protein